MLLYMQHGEDSKIKVGGGGALYMSEGPHKDSRLSEQLDYEGRIHSTEGKNWIKKGGGGRNDCYGNKEQAQHMNLLTHVSNH